MTTEPILPFDIFSFVIQKKIRMDPLDLPMTRLVSEPRVRLFVREDEEGAAPDQDVSTQDVWLVGNPKDVFAFSPVGKESYD